MIKSISWNPTLQVMGIFFIQPVVFGVWLALIPEVQSGLNLDKSQLALGLMGAPTGMLMTLPFAGKAANTFGIRKILYVGFPVFFLSITLIGLVDGLYSLFLVLFLVGVSMSLLELALNVHAGRVEKHTRRVIMNRCHGFWSLGIMTGSLLGSALHSESTVLIILIMCASALFPVAWLLCLGLPSYENITDVEVPPVFVIPQFPAILIYICVFAFGITIIEGAMADWASVYVKEMLGPEAQGTGYGFGLFAAFMALGRFFGDYLKIKLGTIIVARVFVILAILGLIILVTADDLWLALVGFALTGMGVSIGFPLAVTSAASIDDKREASYVAFLSLIALIGFLVGPPIIGFLANVTNLKTGFIMLFPGLLLSLFMSSKLISSKTEGNVR
ncbi:MAG: MFS transporter [SAR324 cluster bacterium]|jgi:MFS family permease|nr:MFS transporter [SAR324 cluster bacterium]